MTTEAQKPAETPAKVETPAAPAPVVKTPETVVVAAAKPVDPPPAKPEVDVTALSKKVADESIADERKRCADINALCKQAGKTDLATGFIETGATVEDARAKLFTALCNDRPPVGPDLAKPEGEGKPKDADGNDKYRAEFKADPAYAKSGMTEDQYVAMRRVDDKLDPLVNPLEPKKAA